MEKFVELPKGTIENINFITNNNLPNSVKTYSWLSIFPCLPINLVANTILLSKSIGAGIVVSGGLLYAYDIIIVGETSPFDIDRHLLTTSGAIIFRQREIHKDFPEHHSLTLPNYYINTSN